MAEFIGTEFDDTIDRRGTTPTPPATGDSIIGRGGNDTLYGGLGNDIINGEDGDDFADGGAGDDIVVGGNANAVNWDFGNDTLYGGAGDDQVLGRDGADVLWGGAGVDRLSGGLGNDVYGHGLGDGGIDTIADEEYAGQGGGTDEVQILDANGADLLFFQFGDDLGITNTADAGDGTFDDGIVVENFFLGGTHVVEYAFGADGVGWDLQSLLQAPMSSTDDSAPTDLAAADDDVTVLGVPMLSTGIEMA